MSAAHFAKMIDGMIWADNELFARAEKLTEEQLHQDLGYSFGTVMRQIVHTVGVQYWWFHFLNSGDYHFMDDEEYLTVTALRPKIEETHALLRAYAARLTDDELNRLVRPKFWREESQPWAVWEAIHQVVNHSTDHRAQTLMFLHRLGGETFQQDYLFYEHPHEIDN